MFKKIHVENFKGFEKADIPFGPLTFFLGKNSSGKSSILNLILAFIQSSYSDTNHPTILTHNGHLVEMGAAKNLWRNKDSENDCSVSFEFHSDSIYKLLKKEIVEQYKRQIFQRSHELIDAYSSKIIRSEIENMYNEEAEEYLSSITKLENSLRESIDENLIFTDSSDYLEKVVFPLHKLETTLFEFANSINSSERVGTLKRWIYHLSIEDRGEVASLSDLTYGYRLRKSISERISGNVFYLKYDFSLSSDSKVYAKCVGLYDDTGDSIVSVDFSEPGADGSSGPIITGLRSDYTDDNIGELASMLNSKVLSGGNIVRCFNGWRSRSMRGESAGLVSFVAEIVSTAQQQCIPNAFLYDVEHVPPLRAHPRRFYLSDYNNLGADHRELFDRLESGHIKKLINDWLARAGVKVDVAQVEEVIKKILIVPNNNSKLELEISDVGFGFSQVLPILAALLNTSDDSLVLIEQPEVHLHPDMQASLGDLFTDLIAGENSAQERAIVIETHSEYLITEVRRHVAEGKVPPNRVEFVYFSTDPNTSLNICQSVEIGADGYLDWPVEFIQRHIENQKKLISLSAE